MKWTFTTIVTGRRRDGLPAQGGKISIIFETDETNPNVITVSLYHGKTLYSEGDISVAASIMPLSAIVTELEIQDEVGLHRDRILIQAQQFVKVFHLLEKLEEKGPTAQLACVLQTPGAVAH